MARQVLEAKAKWKAAHRESRITAGCHRPEGRALRLSDVVSAVFLDDSKVYEPADRLCGGFMCRPRHRFPIRGGVSWRRVMTDNMRRSNLLWQRLLKKIDESSGSGKVIT